MTFGEPTLTANFDAAWLNYEDGAPAQVPNEPSRLAYYMMRSKLSDGRTLHDLTHEVDFSEITEPGQKIERAVNLPESPFVQPPDELFFPAGKVVSVLFTILGRLGRPIRGNTRIEPSSFTMPVLYKNVITGVELRFNIGSLPLGVKRVEAGKFCFIDHPLRYYHCESVAGDMVTWKLIEAFQNGDLLRATMTQEIKFSPYYIEVTDKKILKSLRIRLTMYDELSKRQPEDQIRKNCE